MIQISFMWLKKCVEIPVLFMFFGFMVCDPVTTNFIIYRTCYVSFGYNQSDCEKLGSKDASNATQELEKLVEPYANVIMMTQSLGNQILPTVLCLFIGPWSDKHGRKPVLISTITGFTISGLVSIIIVLIPRLSPWYFVLGSISAVLFGGFPPLLMAIICYITDITTLENRGMRIGILEAVLVFGLLLGTVSSSYIFEIGGYVTVFSITTACYFVACIYTVFVVSESVTYSADQVSTSIFSFANIRDMLHTTLKSRENYARSILLLTIGMTTTFMLVTQADSLVFFLFVREKFKWSLEKYTLYFGVRYLFWIVGTFLGLYVFHKLFKITEVPLLLIGFLAYLASALLQGVADHDWYIYLAAAIRCIASVVTPMGRSLISKLVAYDETGKIFAVTIFVQSLIIMIGTPLYTLIYNYTLDSSPGIFNFVTSGVVILEIVFVLIVLALQKITLNTNAYGTLPIHTEAK